MVNTAVKLNVIAKILKSKQKKRQIYQVIKTI